MSSCYTGFNDLGNSGDYGKLYHNSDQIGAQYSPQLKGEIDSALEYLDHIPPHYADDYFQWIEVGMALHSVSDTLLPDWDRWSQQSEKYRPGECEKKWRSFNGSSGFGIGSLGHWAKEGGWTPTPGKRQGRGAKALARQVSVKRKTAPPPAIEGEVSLARLTVIPSDFPTAAPCSQAPKGVPTTATQTIYRYSPTQFVIRYEWEDLSKPKGRDKTFRQFTIGADGKRVWGKGEEPWPLYRETEALGAEGWPLFQEGEKCVEAARSLGLVSVTLQGSSWGQDAIADGLAKLKAEGAHGVFYLADNDQAGSEKAKKVEAGAHQIDLPCVTISIKDLWPDAPKGADLADLIQWEQSQGMNTEDFIRRLEAEIHAAVERRNQEALASRPIGKGEALKQRIKLWTLEQDVANRITERADILREYGISRNDFEAIATSLDGNSDTPKARRLPLSEFMALPGGGSPILLPGVPSVGVTILGGVPGCGKTTLATDMAGALISGDPILGDVPTRTGSVLIVSSDEPHTETQSKLINRGLSALPDGKLEIIQDWDVSQWGELESAIEDLRPVCVFVDSFSKIHNDPTFDENGERAGQTISRLERLSAKYCIPIIVIHHLAKSKDNKGVHELRGSGSIAASCSAILLMKKQDDGAIILTQPKIRGSEPLNLTLDMDAETGRFTVLGEGNVDDDTKSLGDRLKAFFTANQGTLFEMEEINDHFFGVDRKVLNNALNRLVKRGEIIKRPSKANPRSKVYGIERTGSEGESSSPTLSLPPLHFSTDDMKSETLTTQGFCEIITKSSPRHHHVITTSSPLHDDDPMMMSETFDTQGFQSPNHQIITTSPQEGESGGDDKTASNPVPKLSDDDVPFPGPIPEHWEALKIYNKKQIAHLGWTKEQARSFVKELTGKERRGDMSNDDLIKVTQELNKLFAEKGYQESDPWL